MGFENLTAEELKLVASLPRPPARIDVRVTNICIVEWLPDDERHTGRELYAWANERRPGWAVHTNCRTKADVLAAIERAADVAARSGMIPVLHLEAHGATDDEGLVGPDGAGALRLLSWDELIEPLQVLNAATHCNLVVVAAACTSIAGLKAFKRGPRAPALGLVGTCAPIDDGRLLEAMKEFYRRLADGQPHSLDEIVESASRESAPVALVVQPFMALAYEALLEALICAARPEEQRARRERARSALVAMGHLSEAEIDRRLAMSSQMAPADRQRDWDRMFMIDRHPENADRFSLDVAALMRVLGVAAS